MITINNLSFSYGREKVFSDLTLSLKPGGICGLLGKNGAGKTTLLKMMAGLLFPQQESIDISGEKPADRSVGFLQDLFFIPETFTLPAITPLQYERLYSPFYPNFHPERFRSLLKEFDVVAHKPLNKTSHGQKKKFLIAFGLATTARLMLMDEPTNGLDIPSKSIFRKAVASSLADDQIFVIATHQARDLQSLIDPVIILHDGGIIFNRSMEETSSRLKAAYQSEAPDADTVIFSEKKMGGYLVVTENQEDGFADIDLETLFSAVLCSRERIDRIFQKDWPK